MPNKVNRFNDWSDDAVEFIRREPEEEPVVIKKEVMRKEEKGETDKKVQ